MDLFKLSASEALRMMEGGTLSSEEYVKAFLKQIELREDDVGAWIFLDPEFALDQAREADKRWRDKNAGNLNGLPIGIKDIIDTKDMPTENGSLLCKNRQPTNDAHLVKLLRDEGAVIMGKCVTTEFALSGPGKTKNPRDLECTPGGSSSGSAAAVSDYMVPLAIGSQTGGSVLRPASFTGILGFKPTFGTISRSGMSPISQRLDHPGIYANCVEDIDLVASVILSYDSNDLDMIQNYQYKRNVNLNKPIKFGFVRGPVWNFGEEDMQSGIEDFVKKTSVDVEELDLGRDFDDAARAHEIIMNGSIVNSLINYYQADKSNLHPFTVKRIEAGIPVSASDYVSAIEKAKKMEQILGQVFLKYDAIITPASTGQAPRDLMNTGNAIFNGYWTMMGVPAISLPFLKGKDDLPIGIQFITNWNEDLKLLEICKYILKKEKLAD